MTKDLLNKCLLTGFHVQVSEMALERYYVFPQHRFIEYEEKDIPWLEKFGMGHWNHRPGIYRIGNTFLIHPVIWEQLKTHGH